MVFQPHIAILCLWLLISTSNAQITKGCPPSESIAPCSCKIGSADKQPWITCSGLESVDQLQKSVNGMEGYQFTNFYLENSKLGNVPSGIFKSLGGIESLTFSSTNLTSLSDGPYRPPFLGLEYSLANLEITDSFKDKQSPLTRLSLAHLKKLTIAHLQGNLIPTIGNDWFESGPYQLRELHLLDSSTTKLGSLAFASLSNLRKLAVTGGKINMLSRSMIHKPAVNLEALDFSNNALTMLPPDFFVAMPSLGEVYLEGNAFTVIDEITWSLAWNQLSHVYFSGNPMICDENIKWIYKYRLPEVILGECAQPTKLIGKSLKKLTLNDFA